MIGEADLRKKLNKYMDDDQKYTNPTSRKHFQNEVWPFILSNYKNIFADRGPKNNGDYPHSPYAAWLLVQHMDAFPDRQRKFLNDLKANIPTHPKIKFLEDRVKVNEWILSNYKSKIYYKIKGKWLDEPTTNVRNPDYFNDAKIRANSRQEALENAVKAHNWILVDAVNATNALTQPSYVN